MRIRSNQKPDLAGRNQKIILLAVLLSLFMFGTGYAETQLEDLRKTLKEQEAGIVEKQKHVGPGNRGYIFGKGDIKPPEKETVIPPVYIAPDTELEVKELYRRAKQLFDEGKLQEAKRCLEEVLELNPLHIPAQNFLRRILDLQNRLSFQDSVILSKERMLEADRLWLPPEKIEAEEKPLEVKQPLKTERQRIMEDRAEQIIPEISFTDAHLRDVLMYLSEISGINIVIDEDLFPGSSERKEISVETLATGENSVEYSSQPAPVSDRITISLTNIPLIEALKYILSAKGLKYRIDEYAIVVSTPERLAEVEMVTRYYNLTAGMGMFTEFAKKVREEQEGVRGIAKGLEAKSRITIKEVLEQSGVPFPLGSKVFLDQRTGTLIVRNTPTNLALVEDVLRILDITPFQVEIEAKFIELTQSESQELGLEWMLKGGGFSFGTGRRLRFNDNVADSQYGQYPATSSWTGKEGLTHGERFLDTRDSITGEGRDLSSVQDILQTGGMGSVTDDVLYEISSSESQTPGGNILSISGILTQPQFRMILHALNQTGFSNLLSSPKVTTLNNQQAQIEVVKEVIYPTEFELTPATTNDAGTVVTQPVVTPTAWTTRDIGIILNVTPSVGADRKTINLTLLPEVSLLRGWNDYGIPASVDHWNKIPILQPIFTTKNVATNVVINDGETVVLGGLIKEDLISTEDKVPVLGDIPLLGRLFRSESEQSRKTNLMIFVTANLLTPAGERIKK